MHRIREGRLRRLGVFACLTVVAALAVVSATSASVDVGNSGSRVVFRAADNLGKVFVCKYVGTPGVDERLQTGDNPIDVSINSIPDYHGVGSYFADAQGRSYVIGPEHEANQHPAEPSVSDCPQPEVPPTDVCPNIDGNQSGIPDGMVKDGQGNCVVPPPVDVCPNLDGAQPTVPAGYTLVDGQCVVVPPPVDKCLNIAGNQATVPEGYFAIGKLCFPIPPPPPTYTVCYKGETLTGLNLAQKIYYLLHGAKLGECPPPPPVDVCPNIEGNQSEVPNGMVKDEQGNCVTTPPPPTDVCPNIEGNQATVPSGLVKDVHGNCVTPTSPPPPTVKSDEFMDVRLLKDATPQVQLVDGRAEITYTLLVRNEGPNQAHDVVVTDAAPGGATFLAVTQPVNGSCTVTPALLECSLGTLGPGVERSIVLTARVTQAGTVVNTATATGNGKDTNGANNTDDASTLVTAPATPPTAAPTPKPKPAAKPKPKPAPQAPMCRVLKVTPGMVKANGNRQLVVARVTQSRNPVAGVAVRFTGKGTSKVVKTNARGVARFSIAPRKAGIMLVKITSAKACNSARIGVIGAFEPPVTG
jgi:uncharacterized repeat protein (TIGR01451 family)